jgi:hypothetical protein
MKRSNLVLFLLALGMSGSVFSNVLPVEPLSKGFFATRPTMTFLSEASNAEMTLVVVMGYPGNFGLKPGDSEIGLTWSYLTVHRPFKEFLLARVPTTLNASIALSSSTQIS